MFNLSSLKRTPKIKRNFKNQQVVFTGKNQNSAQKYTAQINSVQIALLSLIFSVGFMNKADATHQAINQTHTSIKAKNDFITQHNAMDSSKAQALSTVTGRAQNSSQVADSESKVSAHLNTNNPNINKLIKQAVKKNLATHPTWLRLHYYESKNKGYESKVENKNFFVSTNGKRNPQAELEAFITAMVLEKGSNKTLNNNIACKFPARTHWVKEQLDLAQSYPNCPKLDAWMHKLDPHQFSIIFAEEYPEAPVSAFGHTLLLINSSKSLADPSAIDQAHALNATVGGNPNHPFVKYAFNSIFGKYPTDITIEPLPEKLSSYLQIDNRDVWIYPLALSKAEVQQIMRHVWETKDIELPYYFTLDNCASEILRYIDIVRPKGSLLDEFKYAVVPSDVVRLLKDNNLITSQTYLPANNTLKQAKLNLSAHTVSDNQLQQLQNISTYKNLPDSSINDKKLIFTAITPANNNPLNAHDLQRITLGVGHQDDTGYLSLNYRGGFNGLLDKPYGYSQNLDLEGVMLTLRIYEDNGNKQQDKLQLQDFTLIRGRSFNPINTADKGDSTLATWGVNLQATKVKDGSNEAELAYKDNPLVASAKFEKGVSYAFGKPPEGTGELPPHLCYALANGAVQAGKGLNHGFRVGVGANLGCRYLLSDNVRLIGEIHLPYWYHGDIGLDNTNNNYWQPSLSIGGQYDFSKNHAIRLEGSHQFLDNIKDKDTIQLSYVRYF